MSRDFRVTIKIVREHFATITVRARDQDEADQLAIAAFYRDSHADEEPLTGELDLPRSRWDEGEPIEHEAVIDPRFRCVDCNKDTQGGEYYMVADEVWAASGMAPHGGMLCLAHLEERIGRWLTIDDFTAVFPRDWEQHVAARTSGPVPEPLQLELLDKT